MKPKSKLATELSLSVVPTRCAKRSWGQRSDFNTTPFTTVNIAVVAPIPSASVMLATAAEPGFIRNIRMAWRRSEARLIRSSVGHTSVRRIDVWSAVWSCASADSQYEGILNYGNYANRGNSRRPPQKYVRGQSSSCHRSGERTHG
jgi:hypothetical protein